MWFRPPEQDEELDETFFRNLCHTLTGPCPHEGLESHQHLMEADYRRAQTIQRVSGVLQ